MFFENLRLALHSLGSNKMRTLLSLLGIMIGVASVITITGLGESASASVTDSIAQAGLENLTVMPSTRSREVRDTFTTELLEPIIRFVPDVLTALPQSQTNVQIRAGSESWDGTMSAVPSSYARTMDYQVEQGRFISPEDEDSRRSVLVLGAETAAELFPETDPVGQRIRVSSGDQTRSFEVIGTMQTKSSGFGANFDTVVFLPYATYAQRYTRNNQIGTIILRTTAGADPLAVQDNLEEFLDGILGEENYRVLSPATIAAAASEVTGTLQLLLAGIATISLLVGGIGIMNIMLVAVAERTREIGIRKAIGASPGVILVQFVIEAGVLTTIGGLIGIALGIGISAFAASSFGWNYTPNYAALGLAVGVSTTIGLFFGFYPAYRAARLDPIQALSYE